MKHAVIGMLAHVDAGKTTFSESLLYHAKAIRKLGRVDHGDAFLDYYEQERNRGITIFSKQAHFTWKDTEIQLLDTPGHVDFSAEMERTLQVLDYAVVIISALDGVQVHTETIWNLLKHYQIPTFVFVNKMDASYVSKEELLTVLKEKLDEHCIAFDETTIAYDECALCDETLLEHFLETECLSDAELASAIQKRMIFPCFFGSALKLQGIETFLDRLDQYVLEKHYPQAFGANVYQISQDEFGNQLTHLKIMGGSLKAKAVLPNGEKIDQIRLYHGNKYELLQEAKAGMICSVKGIKGLHAGEGIGISESEKPVLNSYLRYRIVPQGKCDLFRFKEQLMQLCKEDPQLHVHYDEKTKELYVQMMGEIQIEVLKQVIKDRFQIDVEFDQGSVTYKETITESVEGVGHFEPLRHYAEVHVLLEPLPAGSGVQITSSCSQDQLSKNWQRLILSHLAEVEHIGVLTGSPITDVKITLLGGKAHLKHTEGGDFREATYRAVRNALKKTTSVLLEPYYAFRMELPNVSLSKAIYDIEQMHGTFAITSETNDQTILTGSAPVSKMQNYQRILNSYTKGMGKLICHLQGFYPCVNEDEVIVRIGYDSEMDLAHPTGSIFCEHGAGVFVPWNEVEHYMHLPYLHKQPKSLEQPVIRSEKRVYGEEELERIFKQTYRTSTKDKPKKLMQKTEKSEVVKMETKELCYLIDGYNLIFASDELKELAETNIDAARMHLIDLMANYQGYRGGVLILVFDAYQVEDSSFTKDGDIYVVYTKKAQTADQYIEQATHHLASEYQVHVVTSDAAIQLIVMGQGATRISSREFLKEVKQMGSVLLKEHQTAYNFAQPLADLRKWKP